MPRFALAAFALVVSAALGTAGPVPTWGYRIYSQLPVGPILASESGLTVGETIHLGPILQRPTPSVVTLPDAANYPEDTFAWGDTNTVGVSIEDEVSGARSLDAASWTVRQDWRRVDGPSGPAWQPLPTTEGLLLSSNATYINPHIVNGQQLWDRYDMAIGDDGSLTLSMTPDVVPPDNMPEPGTFVIVGIAAAGVFGARLRRKRRSAVAAGV